MKPNKMVILIIIVIIIGSHLTILNMRIFHSSNNGNQDTPLTMAEYFDLTLSVTYYNYPSSRIGSTYVIRDTVSYSSVISFPIINNNTNSSILQHPLWDSSYWHDLNDTYLQIVENFRDPENTTEITYVMFDSLDESYVIPAFFGNRSNQFIAGEIIEFHLQIREFPWKDFYYYFAPPFINESWIDQSIYITEPLYVNLIFKQYLLLYHTINTDYFNYNASIFNNKLYVTINNINDEHFPIINYPDHDLHYLPSWTTGAFIKGNKSFSQKYENTYEGVVRRENGTIIKIGNNELSFEEVLVNDTIIIQFDDISNRSVNDISTLYQNEQLDNIVSEGSYFKFILTFDKMYEFNLGIPIYLLIH